MALFSIDVHHHIHLPPTPSDQYAHIIERLDAMSQAQRDLAAALEAKAEQINKGIAEVVAATAALQDQIAALDTITPELQAAFDRVAAGAQALDDLNPDPTPAG